MSTTLPRIQVTLPNDVADALTSLAKRDGIPRSAKALALIRHGLEVYEDMIFDERATERLNEKGVQYLSHEAVWK